MPGEYFPDDTNEMASVRDGRSLRATPEFLRKRRRPRIIFKRHPWSEENTAFRYFKKHHMFPPEVQLSLSKDFQVNPDGLEQLEEDKEYMGELFREYPSEYILLCSSPFARTRMATDGYKNAIFGSNSLGAANVLYDGRLGELILGPLEALIVAGREKELAQYLVAYFDNKQQPGRAAYEWRPAQGILDREEILDISREYELREMIDETYDTADPIESMYADFEGESVIQGGYRFSSFLDEYRELIERPNQITVVDSHAGLILGAELRLKFGAYPPEDLPSIAEMTRTNCCYVEYEGERHGDELSWNLVYETRRPLDENFK